MKLAIFGGTGKTGQHLVKQALDSGFEVTLLARTPSKMALQHNNLQIVTGSILEPEQVDAAIRDADAVLSLLGPTSNEPEFVISRGIDNILDAMQRHDIRRIVISAGAGVRDPLDKPKLIDRFFGVLLGVISKNVVADMRQVVQKVRSSDRDWTIVRVPMLTDQPAQGNLKVGYVGDITTRIARADLAAFMLKQVTDDTHVGKAPAISNTTI